MAEWCILRTVVHPPCLTAVFWLRILVNTWVDLCGIIHIFINNTCTWHPDIFFLLMFLSFFSPFPVPLPSPFFLFFFCSQYGGVVVVYIDSSSGSGSGSGSGSDSLITHSGSAIFTSCTLTNNTAFVSSLCSTLFFIFYKQPSRHPDVIFLLLFLSLACASLLLSPFLFTA